MSIEQVEIKDSQADLDDDDDKEHKENNSTSLTKWKNEPTVMKLKQDLSDAKPSHDEQIQRIKDWLDNLNITGAAKVKVPKGSSSITPKLIRKQAEWRYAALSEPFLSTDDVFNVNPVTYEDKAAAEQNELVLNNQFNTQINKVDFIDEYVRTAVDEGSVICKTGWKFEEAVTTQTVPTYRLEATQDPEVIQKLQLIGQFKQNSPGQYENILPEWIKAFERSFVEQIPYMPVKDGEEEETSKKVVANHPTVEVCNFKNVIIDPTAKGDVSKAGFIIHSFETSMAELKKDQKYKNLDNLDKIDITNNSPLAEPDHAIDTGVNNFNFSDKPRTKVIVYEYWGYWDIAGNGVLKPIVAAWIGNQMIRMEESPYQSLPFTITHYLPVRRSNYGEPDGVLIEDNQKIIGAVTRGMIDLMGKSANAQTGFRQGTLDVTNRRKFANGEDYEFNGNASPDNAIFMHKYPEIPQSAPLLIMNQNQEAESLTGVKSFAGGISGDSLGNVAAGVRGALDAASKRELGILRRLSQGILEIGRKFIAMNAEFLSDREVVRITNDKFIDIRRDDLPGNFDLKLSISTAEEDNNKAQELAFMLQTMGNNMDPEMSRILLADIAKLRKMPELANKIKNYQPQPDPMQQKKMELEIALLEAQIATEQAKAASLGSSAELHSMKVGTEQAKQGHLKADTDLKNLNYVEQETGTTQERELQKQTAQAKGNAQLALLNHALAPEKPAKY